MSLHSWPLQQAIFSKLNGASLVDYDGSAISGVFDDVPEQTNYPYVVIGEETATEAGTKDVDAHEHTLTIHVWSQYRGLQDIKKIMAQIYTQLHNTAITVSGIQSGYYFTTFDTNIGSGITAYENAVGTSPVGIGTSFLDNIYRVHSAKNVTGPAFGIGSTTLRRVTVSVSSTEGIGIGSGMFGKYSWGRLHDFIKKGDSAFTAINNDGVTGIITGPVIIRTRDLKESFI
mgnify:CR=1 FL=1